MNKIEHHVRIGQIKMGTDGEILKAILGSCVGIGLLWKKKGVYALAHCLLPHSPEKGPNLKGKFVDQAIPNLLQNLGIEKADLSEIVAVVAGGGQMMSDQKIYASPLGKVGEENLKAAKLLLAEYKIKTIAFEPGGDQGSSITIDCSTGDFNIQKFSKLG